MLDKLLTHLGIGRLFERQFGGALYRLFEETKRRGVLQSDLTFLTGGVRT